MASQAAHKRWLKVTALVVGIGGPIFSFGSVGATAEPARLTLDILSWPLDGVTTYASPDTRFLSALTGGFLLGWGVLIWRLADLAYDAAPEAVRRAVVSGILAWFVADSAGSLASGNGSNVAFNVAVLLLAVGPMWRPARG
ncbi:hypothetical protein [Phenylobacterium sp.]|uniref:hypothetical protein n=1 Tax=Phenylobacterium sp. TaxID=1871053 RepID=UPI003D2BE86B